MTSLAQSQPTKTQTIKKWLGHIIPTSQIATQSYTNQGSTDQSKTDQSITHHRTCTICEAMCGIVIQVEDGQIKSIKGDKNDPLSKGFICPKATALQDLYEDSDRVFNPLKKVNGKFEPISWDDALNEVVAKLLHIQKTHGTSSVATYLGNPNVHNLGAMLFGSLFLQTLRTRNKFSATSADQLPHHLVASKLFGHMLNIPIPDIDHTDFFIIIGGNPLASNGSIMTAPDIKNRLKAISKRGKVVVIDPRKSETAQVVDEHHFITPSSDCLLLLAMLNTLFADDLVDLGRSKDWLLGGDAELENIKKLVSPYTPRKVAKPTGMSAKAIRQLTHEFAQAEHAVCYGRMGVSVQAFGGLNQYLIILLNLLTNRLDEKGGLRFPKPAVNVKSLVPTGGFNRYQSRVRSLPSFASELPVSVLAEEMLTEGAGQIKALVLAAGNPVLSTPNSEQLDKALAGLEFIVSLDMYVNETNRHADIILPVPSPLEREHYDIIFNTFAVHNIAKWSDPLFPVRGDTRHDWQIYLELMMRMQIAKQFEAILPNAVKSFMQKPLSKLASPIANKLTTSLSQHVPATVIDIMLRAGDYGLKSSHKLSVNKLKQSPSGVDLGILQAQMPDVIRHKHKKIDLSIDFFLSDLKRVDVTFFAKNGLKVQKASKAENTESNHGDKALPLKLIGRRHVRSNNSWLHNAKRLVKGKNRCTALIHPEDAKIYKIQDGDMVKLGSAVGSITVEAEVSSEIMPGVVSVPHGFGHNKPNTSWQTANNYADNTGGGNSNAITNNNKVDELSGNAVLNGVPICVEKCAA